MKSQSATRPQFETWRSWTLFEHNVKRKSRYLRDRNAQNFLETLLATSQGRRKKISSGSIFWRAQQGHGLQLESHGEFQYEIPAPLQPERMKPLLGVAREGRANPKGIPCLYLATDRHTAMAETRPWLGLHVSVGQFKISKDLVVVDCSVLHGSKPTWLFEEPSPQERERAVWAAIDHAFSEPVNSDDATADYAPTQVLAETFRADGCDGVVYKSLLGSGHNIALFDVGSADLMNCFLYKPKAIEFTFEEVANPYFVKKYIEQA